VGKIQAMKASQVRSFVVLEVFCVLAVAGLVLALVR
jgi:hypothetical protein